MMRHHPGHEKFVTVLRRAAYTSGDYDEALLFVSAGIDTSVPLDQQTDSFWWGGQEFDKLREAYEPFAKIIRGYDPNQGGLQQGPMTLTLDGGCGYGGELVATRLNALGEVQEVLRA